MDKHFINFMVVLWLCCCSVMELSLASNATYPIYCTATERRALVSFKQGLIDPSARLSSWVGENCCQWYGITCDFISGKVTNIDLHNTFYPSDGEFFSLINYEVSVQEYKRTCLGGDISSSLLKLKHLNYLDLSLNNFEGAPIPSFFGKFKRLRYLNLSSANFGGVIMPFHLGNLSNLNYLDLHAYNLLVDEGSYIENQWRGENLEWLSGLSSLKYLDIGSVILSSVQANLMQTVTRLSSLLELHLSGCGISSFDSSISFQNLTSLKVLDLSSNSINSSLLWLSNLTSLKKIDISSNLFQGAIPQNFVKLKNLEYLAIGGSIQGEVENRIPSFLRNLCQLRYLDLHDNHFGGKLDEFLGSSSSNCSVNKLETLNLGFNRLVGEIPNSLGMFENLQFLDLSNNELWGSLPNSIGNLSSLKKLDTSSNLFNGTIPPNFGQLSELIEFRSYENSWKSIITEAQLMNLTKLELLIISTSKENDQHLVFNVSYGWIPPFRLKVLYLENCLVGPQFPVWLQVQTQLSFVTLSNVGIFDIPNEWIPKMSSHIVFMDLSNNMLKGNLCHLLVSQDANLLDYQSHNNLSKEPIPLRYPNLVSLFLQNNSLSGHIPVNMGDLMPNLQQLELSQNHLNGTIPSIATKKMSYLYILSLSNNQLSGELIDYNWDTLEDLVILDLANNNLYGKIPKTIGLLTSLRILVLSNNHFHGEIPESLQNCSYLKIIDFGRNKLYGSLPSWIGRVVSDLRLINLRSNLLSGTIPRQWCNLSFLRILDLSNNNLFGDVPSCLYNWTTFSGEYYYPNNLEDIMVNITNFGLSFVEKSVLVMKGTELEYNTTLKYVMTIDLSRNKLSGEIPKEITKFINLICLNLSSNDLIGTIPENIGAMQRLETLDLSNNRLFGKIPTSLASLHFLEKLNLSFNNLTGSIPTGNQLQTLDDPSIYEGNPFLCGFPLQTKCNGNENPTNFGIYSSEEEEEVKENDSEMFGFYMGMAIGFPIGLNILFFTIFTSQSRRIWYFRFIHRVSYIILDKIDLFILYIRRSTRWR